MQSFFISYLETGLRIAVIVAGSLIFYWIFDACARKASQNIRARYLLDAEHDQRFGTMIALVRTGASIGIVFVAGSMILNVLNVNIAPILTGAGIIGVLASFSAQSLIKDVLAGFFILSENQYGPGAHVKLDECEGVVQHLSLRTTVLCDDEGQTIIIPNGGIRIVRVFKSKWRGREEKQNV